MKQIHGTVLDIAGKGVLLLGPSGAGKSDVALRLMDRGAVLIADDRVELYAIADKVLATAPKSLRGYIEVRGLGITSVPVSGGTTIALVVELVPSADVPRLPKVLYKGIAGRKIPLIRLNAFEVSTPIKIELAVGGVERIGGEGPSDRESRG
ncbi:MAG: HPr kinase/phosphatase C-terminal domain-containing protein [Kordiimonadaceae bacterium]|nr:HPr kinase/phosphatase C-terminal domain-containing protein [Kordiimonadaceae bacterium]